LMAGPVAPPPPPAGADAPAAWTGTASVAAQNARTSTRFLITPPGFEYPD
jgi:hypothetical protein